MKWPRPDRPPSKYRRFAAGSSDPDLRVDRTGGQWGSGLIQGVSLITRGEALGHRQWIDGIFLDQLVRSLGMGLFVKSTYGHPDMCGDGIGQYVGRIYGPAHRDGDRVRADLHINPAAHQHGHAEALFLMAETAPEDFGMSIRFTGDVKAEEAFRVTNSEDVDGRLVFKSPDADNVHHYSHARLLELHAADPVLDPAANPSGLFSAKNSAAQHAYLNDAEAAMAYALGFSDTAPETSELFGLDVERVRSFAARLSVRKGWTLGFDPTTLKESMTDDTDDTVETDDPTVEPETENDEAETANDETADDETEEDPTKDPEDSAQDSAASTKDLDTTTLSARIGAALSTRVAPGERQAEGELCQLLSGEALARQLSKLEDRPPFHWLNEVAASDVQTLLTRCPLTPAQTKNGLTAALVELKKAELSEGRYCPAPVHVDGEQLSTYAVIAKAFENQPRLSVFDDTGADRDIDTDTHDLRRKYPGTFKD